MTSGPPKWCLPVSIPVRLTTLWAGTNGHGLLHHNSQGWTNLDSLDGLAQNDIVALLEASDGALWIVTEAGVSRYKPSP